MVGKISRFTQKIKRNRRQMRRLTKATSKSLFVRYLSLTAKGLRVLKLAAFLIIELLSCYLISNSNGSIVIVSPRFI